MQKEQLPPNADPDLLSVIAYHMPTPEQMAHGLPPVLQDIPVGRLDDAGAKAILNGRSGVNIPPTEPGNHDIRSASLNYRRKDQIDSLRGKLKKYSFNAAVGLAGLALVVLAVKSCSTESSPPAETPASISDQNAPASGGLGGLADALGSN